MITQRVKPIEEKEFKNLIDRILEDITDLKKEVRIDNVTALNYITDFKDEVSINQTDQLTVRELANNERILALFELTEDVIRGDIMNFNLKRSFAEKND